MRLMHERKALMAERADAFVALPGGLGTLEEIFEVWSWRQLGFHAKPIGFLNAGGFWTPLLGALRGIAGFWLPPRIHSGRPRRCPRSARLAGGAARAAPQHPAARARSESAVAEQVCGAAGSTRMPSAC